MKYKKYKIKIVYRDKCYPQNLIFMYARLNNNSIILLLIYTI